MSRIVRTTNSVPGVLATEGKRWDVIELVGTEWKRVKRDVGISEASDYTLALKASGRHGMLVEHDDLHR